MGESDPTIGVCDVKEMLENASDVQVREKGDGIELVFNELVARRGNEFVFLDRVFDSGDDFHGAVGTTMMPVSQEEFERRVEEYKDYEYSPLAHIYNDIDTPKSWDEWIEAEMAYDTVGMVLDQSYAHKYGDDVRTWTSSELDFEAEYVECIGGGRMFSTAFSDFDRVYRPDLLALARGVEDHGLGISEVSEE